MKQAIADAMEPSVVCSLIEKKNFYIYIDVIIQSYRFGTNIKIRWRAELRKKCRRRKLLDLHHR